MKKVLILTDTKAGHENQSKAFARALGAEFDLVEVHFKSGFAKSLSYLFSRLGIHAATLFSVEMKRGDAEAQSDSASASLRLCASALKKSLSGCSAVIGTGSGTFYPAAVLAKKLGVPAGVVLYPRGYRLADYACILAPAFDRPAAAANVVAIPVNLTATDDAFYAAGEKNFLARYAPSAKPAVAVILGGPNKAATMTAAWAKDVLAKVFAATEGCERWVTTSRRTPPEVEAVVDSFPFDYKLLYSKDHFNPIPAFVVRAKKLYVSAESTGMLSEAVTRGHAAVEVLDNFNPGASKFRRFVDGLVAAKAARYLGAAGDAATKIDLAPAFAQAKALLGL